MNHDYMRKANISLGDIDRDVARLLESAGLAINTLICAESDAEGNRNTQSQSIEQRKQSFATASSHYFSLLSSIDIRLRRHISALEDAEIVPSEKTAKGSQSSTDAPTVTVSTSNSLLPRQAATSRDVITNGGLGNLDIGWLNSRNNNVGKAMEAELWKEAHELIEKTLEAKGRGDVAMSDDAAAPSQQL
ncbi:MAG: hypothetical protein Q9172_003182 [Xanthocarpia lactea]